jgi:hypothetical protein
LHICVVDCESYLKSIRNPWLRLQLRSYFSGDFEGTSAGRQKSASKKSWLQIVVTTFIFLRVGTIHLELFGSSLFRVGMAGAENPLESNPFVRIENSFLMHTDFLILARVSFRDIFRLAT